MKTKYIIYEDYYGSTHIEFDTKEEAEKYCKLLNLHINQYKVRENVCYESLEDYKNLNPEKYTDMLKGAIQGLINDIKEFGTSSQNEYCVLINKHTKFTTSFKELKEIVENGQENCKFDFLSYKSDFYGWDDVWYKVKPSDYPKFVKAYQEALLDLANMKKSLQKISKELKNVNFEKETRKEDKEQSM